MGDKRSHLRPCIMKITQLFAVNVALWSVEKQPKKVLTQGEQSSVEKHPKKVLTQGKEKLLFSEGSKSSTHYLSDKNRFDVSNLFLSLR